MIVKNELGHEYFGVLNNDTPFFVSFPMEPNGCLIANVLIIAKRLETGKCKTWAGTVSMERLNLADGEIVDENIAVRHSGGATMNQCTVAPGSSANDTGVQLNSINGVEVQWYVKMTGIYMFESAG